MNFNRSSGILLHPSSFPGRFGIGDFGPNAYEFIDFLEKSKQKLWQILPLGPTSFGDSPYQSFSTFAGNPLFISPGILAKKGYLKEEDLDNFPYFSQDKVEYGKLIPEKNKLLEKAFENFQTKATKETKVQYKKFCEKHISWLEDYAFFVAIKDYFIEERKKEGYSKLWKSFEKETIKVLEPNVQMDYYFGAVWSTWPKGLKNRQSSIMKQWKQKLKRRIDYYKFLQFEFFDQWLALKKYANEKGIKIIGDIPIFVAYDSADVWAQPDHFYIDEKGFPTVVAGVPPDYFSETGQLWGNPLYHWENHKKEGYRWWIRRIKNTLCLVDILRIDHFRGFESYWAIPFGDKDATGGQWKKGPGRDLFDMVKKELGDLPIIAEDLGVITEEVSTLRDDLGFPGMRVLQFAFDSTPTNAYLPHNYTMKSVVYTGTHDNDTTIGWYQGATEQEKDHFRRYMNVSGQTPSWDLIRLAFSSTAMFCIVPLQDILELNSDARMNVPSVPAGNWQFRYQKEMLQEQYCQRLSYLCDLFGR